MWVPNKTTWESNKIELLFFYNDQFNYEEAFYLQTM